MEKFDKEVVDYLKQHYYVLLKKHGIMLEELNKYTGDESHPLHSLIQTTKTWLTEEEKAEANQQGLTTSQGAE